MRRTKIFESGRRAIALVLAAAALAASGRAAAECEPIDALPYTIIEPGRYCLTRDVSTPGHGITIMSDDVAIDLSGHRIEGPTDPGTTHYCISSFGYRDIRIRNGAIRGCLFGVYLSDFFDAVWQVGFDGGGHVVEDLEVIGSTFRGMRIEGNANIVRHNVVRHVGGSSVYSASIMIGIEVFGPGTVVEGNSVHEVRGFAGLGEGVGIAMNTLGSGSFMRNNLVSFSGRDQATSPGAWPGTGRSTWGIWVGGPPTRGIVVEDNLVAHAVFGITIHRTTQGLLARNTAVGALIPFYLPSLTGTPLSTYGDDNICDQATCLELIEDDYFPL